MKINLALTSLMPILFLLGCTSSPPVLHATRALINEPVQQINSNVVPLEFTQLIQTKPIGYQGRYKSIEFTLGKKYTSALGEQCRELFLKQDQNSGQTRQAMCKNSQTEQWLMAPQVIKNKNNAISFGA
ncbi:DVU3141 family protein [Pseudoalteromonas sp. Angola-7]|uniref:DVU3141 family protein n=1 Tax=Pseudoalteromonas sp. Angola-7 TaxID=3025336 RepID=UPI0023596DD3|nr:DVU3141 family protein [Pseudoalteromonas sp. Angola-7]MDC9529663.1 hypothetical protein [Pseudoalteromonas sp. Angola-7]